MKSEKKDNANYKIIQTIHKSFQNLQTAKRTILKPPTLKAYDGNGGVSKGLVRSKKKSPGKPGAKIMTVITKLMTTIDMCLGLRAQQR